MPLQPRASRSPALQYNRLACRQCSVSPVRLGSRLLGHPSSACRGGNEVRQHPEVDQGPSALPHYVISVGRMSCPAVEPFSDQPPSLVCLSTCSCPDHQC